VPSAPEFVTAVGDDAINRFDEARKRKKKKKKLAKPEAPAQAEGGEPKSETPVEGQKGGERRGGGHKGNRNHRGHRNNKPKKDAPAE
jgi:hypothetical protein